MLLQLAHFALTTIWPPDQDNALDTARARTMVLFAIAMIVMTLLVKHFVAPMTVAAHNHHEDTSVYAASGLLAFPLLFRLTGNLKLATHAASLYAAVALIGVIIHEGGLFSFFTFQTIPVAAGAIFFCGWRFGLVVSGGIALAAWWIFLTMPVERHMLPEDILGYLLLVTITSIVMGIAIVSSMFAIFGRNIELRTAELEQATRAAEAASAAKSQFLATVSHEIRTPIQGVLGMADILVEGPLNGEQRQSVRTIQDSGTALLTILNDVLDFSKVEANQMTLEHRPFALRACIEDVAALLSQTAREKGLMLVVDVAPHLPPCLMGDVGRMRQILTNLLGNALKFTQKGHVAIVVTSRDRRDRRRSAGAEERGQVTLHFQVIDTGIGIPADKKATIFEDFKQAEDFTTRAYGGTGLGLAISKRLVAAMGGHLGVESAEGKGSTFHFTLAFETAHCQEDVAPFPAVAHLQDAHVDVAIENAALRTSCMRLLDHWGISLGTIRANGVMGDVELWANDQPEDTADLEPSQRVVVAQTHMLRAGGSGRTLPALSVQAVGNIVGDAAAPVHKLPLPLRAEDFASALGDALGAQCAARDTHASAADGPVARSGQARRVLVADDNATNRLVLQKMLSSVGYEVSFAADGQEAADLALSDVFDLILMDISMPRLDGVAATGLIRGHERAIGCPPVPILALTAHVQSSDRARFLEAGMDNVLTKPIRKTALLKAISEALSGKAA